MKLFFGDVCPFGLGYININKTSKVIQRYKKNLYMSTLSTIFFICLHISIVPNIPTNTRIDKEIITIILKLFQ